MTDPTQMTLVEAADAIRARTLSARELTEACLGRIERLQPVLNCFISPDPEGALAAAGRADAALAQGAKVGPLHGVPLAHKDMYYRAGVVSTCGSKIRRDFKPDHTATVLDRLAGAGALHLGGLNMAEFAFGPTGHNVHWGDCRNPWNPAHITGGSSSGSGSSVGGRLVFGALGSDTGGSVRLPAAACGIVGIKPTQTRVSRYGVMGLSFSLDNVGPLARTVRDCARLLHVIAGRDGRDPTSSAQPVPDYEAATVDARIKGTRIGVPANYYFEDLSDEVRALLDAGLKTFEGLGAEIVQVTVPDHERLADLMNVVMGSEAAALHAHWMQTRPQDYSEQIQARLQPGLAYPATHYLQALQVRPEIAGRFCDAVFSRCDVLYLPVFGTSVPTREETDVKASPGFAAVLARITRNTRPINYLGFPSLAVPSGFTANGLPASFQLVGRPFAEATLFRFGAAYEAATDWHRMAPNPAGKGG